MCQVKKEQEREFEHLSCRVEIFALTQTGACHSVDCQKDRQGNGSRPASAMC